MHKRHNDRLFFFEEQTENSDPLVEQSLNNNSVNSDISAGFDEDNFIYNDDFSGRNGNDIHSNEDEIDGSSFVLDGKKHLSRVYLVA